MGQAERAVQPGELDAEVEAGAEGRALERAGNGPVRAAAQTDVHHRAGADRVDRRHVADHRGDLVCLGIADAGAFEHAGEAVAAAQSGAKVDDRPLGAFGERLDRVGRRHPPAGVGAKGKRLDRERLGLLELDFGIRQARRRAAARAAGRATRRRSRAGSGDEAAEPFERTDPLAEIDDEIELAGLAPVAWPRWPKAGSAGAGTR